MKILICHNRYQHPGGEDEVVFAEKAMLEENGHEVIFYYRLNEDFKKLSFIKKLKFLFFESRWSKKIYKELSELIKKERPDVAHFHNVLYLITPSAYQACFDHNIPIVQTLHNYRPLCPIGVFYRQGKVCEDCLVKGKKSLVFNKCWKDSRLYSFALYRIMQQFKKKKIYSQKVNCFIAPSEFTKEKFIQNGFDSNIFAVKPNFLISDPGGSTEDDGYALFVGSLQEYKGINSLVKLWENVDTEINLKMIGSGPLEKSLEENAKTKNIQFLGQRSLEETLEYMKKARFIIIPSSCFETFSRVVIEAFACGKPVLANNLGVFKSIIDEEKNGFLFDITKPEDMVKKVHLLAKNPELARKLGENARKIFLSRYGQEENYSELMTIYNDVITQYAHPM